MLVLLVPVFFGMMGFAIDLAQLYLMRSELQAAANSAAMAAASRLIGTDASTGESTDTAIHALDAAAATYESDSGFGNRYAYARLPLNTTTGILTSTVVTPSFYQNLADVPIGQNTDGGVGGADARYAKVSISADAPLLFWNFLPIVQDPKISVAVEAVAGVSAPVCTACGIEPLAIATSVTDGSDSDFGFGPADTQHSFTFYRGTSSSQSSIQYALLNRFNPSSTDDSNAQAFRNGAGGMPPAVASGGNIWQQTQTYSCTAIGTANTVDDLMLWPDSVANSNQAPDPIRAFGCGLAIRLDPAYSDDFCNNISNFSTLTPLFAPSQAEEAVTAYTDYTGNGRRVITVAIVDNLGSPTVIYGFRQFLIDAGSVNPSTGQFTAIYVGSKMPLKQGVIGGCTHDSSSDGGVGPGKIVLHR